MSLHDLPAGGQASATQVGANTYTGTPGNDRYNRNRIVAIGTDDVAQPLSTACITQLLPSLTFSLYPGAANNTADLGTWAFPFAWMVREVCVSMVSSTGVGLRYRVKAWKGEQGFDFRQTAVGVDDLADYLVAPVVSGAWVDAYTTTYRSLQVGVRAPAIGPSERIVFGLEQDGTAAGITVTYASLVVRYLRVHSA